MCPLKITNVFLMKQHMGILFKKNIYLCLIRRLWITPNRGKRVPCCIFMDLNKKIWQSNCISVFPHDFEILKHWLCACTILDMKCQCPYNILEFVCSIGLLACINPAKSTQYTVVIDPAYCAACEVCNGWYGSIFIINDNQGHWWLIAY